MGWLIALFIFYIITAVAIWFFQGDLIYYPTKELTVDPKAVGFEFEDVTLRTKDDLKIHGWLIPHKESRDVLLFCHGNGGNISSRVDIIKSFHNLGLNILIFDYRGYGSSEGRPDEKGTYLDAESAWNYLTTIKKFSPNNIILIGRSLGGAVASYIAAKENPKALILDSTFPSIPDMARKQFPFLPVSLMPLYSYSNKKRIIKIKCPVLIIHSKDDEIIPFSHSQALFRRAKEPKTFLKIRGSHNDGFFESKEKYLKVLKDFIEKLSSL